MIENLQSQHSPLDIPPIYVQYVLTYKDIHHISFGTQREGIQIQGPPEKVQQLVLLKGEKNYTCISHNYRLQFNSITKSPTASDLFVFHCLGDSQVTTYIYIIAKGGICVFHTPEEDPSMIQKFARINTCKAHLVFSLAGYMSQTKLV